MGNGIRGAIALAAIALSAIASMAWGGTSPATPPAAAAQGFAPDQGTGASGENLVVYLMTIGQGHAIWEKFGHNAIWVEDRATGQAIAYNYGIFDFEQPGFYKRLAGGNMLYQMVPFDARRLTEAYTADDRTIWLQELALSPRQRTDLLTFLEWNARPGPARGPAPPRAAAGRAASRRESSGRAAARAARSRPGRRMRWP
jgi:hypothetical protein